MRYDKKFNKLRCLLFFAVFGLFLLTASSSVRSAPETPKDQPAHATEQDSHGDTAGAPPETANAAGPNGEEMVFLNVQDADIKDVIKQISKATGRNFIIDDKVRGKVTIISEKPMTREEAYQTFLSALEVAGYTIVKGPAGVIKIISLKEAIQNPIPTHVDTTPITDSFITRLIALQNISAVEMSNAIKGLVSREGNLFAYPATNTLIITDSGTNIDRLMKIIKELDQEGPQQVLEIIPVNNASARDVGQMVNQLFEREKAASKRSSPGKKGGELEEMAEVSKIIPDERTNALIVLASRRAIDKVRNIIQKLDQRLDPTREGKIHVYFLKHAQAKQMAEMLSTLTSGSGGSKSSKGSSAGPLVAEFEGGMKITADEATNSLVITATPKDYQTLIEKVISQLDIPRRQVYLESVVMELTVRKGGDYGVGGFGGLSKGPFKGFVTDPYPGASGGAGILSSFMSGAVPTFPTGLLGGLIGNGTVPITIGDTTKNIPSAGIFFSALSTYGDANVISTPSILTLDNEEAKIEVKGKEYYKGNPLVSATGTQYSTQASETGLILKITPQIGEGDNISMKIEQSLSDFSGVSNDPQVPRPTKERSIKTSVVTKDGQTVVLGGLMEDKSGTDKSKIPLLGDIPILGNLFKRTTISKQKVNLLIFITPHVVKDPTDFAAILKKKIEERNKFIDENYGKRQRAAIKKSITDHREDLLEFKGDMERSFKPVTSVTTTPIPQAARQPVITAPQQPQTELGETRKMMHPESSNTKPIATTQTPVTTGSSSYTSTPATAPQGRVKAPVISVPPPAPGARGEELDLAY
ncbi:MAG: type II secretion system protein GspD [Deltaproteobacteria bacterium CG11_big_fil_rev_8_21_14_0_20_49_13]|nr:MAG: type II secretion system protein GspD [Deltaproteobacteria bacterium CG11_big_fil_rev_8_21_14_0_20_49_13]